MSDAAERPTNNTPHYVNPAPWDPYVSEKLTAEQEKYYMPPEVAKALKESGRWQEGSGKQ